MQLVGCLRHSTRIIVKWYRSLLVEKIFQQFSAAQTVSNQIYVALKWNYLILCVCVRLCKWLQQLAIFKRIRITCKNSSKTIEHKKYVPHCDRKTKQRIYYPFETDNCDEVHTHFAFLFSFSIGQRVAESLWAKVLPHIPHTDRNSKIAFDVKKNVLPTIRLLPLSTARQKVKYFWTLAYRYLIPWTFHLICLIFSKTNWTFDFTTATTQTADSDQEKVSVSLMIFWNWQPE